LLCTIPQHDDSGRLERLETSWSRSCGIGRDKIWHTPALLEA
jgi:hypothetical protein